MKKRKKMGKFVGRVILASGVLLTGLFAALIFYFIRTDAPIIEGKVIFQQKYKNSLTLDIYLPTNDSKAPSPTLMFIHGGAWIGGSKESINLNRFNSAVNRLRDSGFTVISPQYSLATEDQSPFPYCVEDVFEAANWILLNKEKYNLDLDRFGVFGESAGGHLALMLAYASPANFNLNLEIPEIRYVVDVYGPTELNALYQSTINDSTDHIINRLPEPLKQRLHISERLFGFNPSEDTVRTREFANRFSPLTYLDQEAPPTLIIHGTKDQVVPVTQSDALELQLDSLGIENEVLKLEGMNHGFVGATKPQKDKVQQAIFDFIIKNMSGIE